MAPLYREPIDRREFIPRTNSSTHGVDLLGGIHGAGTPAQPTRPATDRLRARQPRSEEGRAGAGRGAALARSGALLRSTGNPSTGENSFPGQSHPRMAWIYWAVSMALAPPCSPPAQPRSEGGEAGAGRGAALARSGAWLRSTEDSFPRWTSSTHGVDLPDVPEECRRRGGVRLRGREPHGCGDRAYRDVLAASPAISPLPANPSTQPLLLTLLQRVQGRRPCNTETPY